MVDAPYMAHGGQVQTCIPLHLHVFVLAVENSHICFMHTTQVCSMFSSTLMHIYMLFSLCMGKYRWVSPEFVKDSTYLGVAEMIRSGTTCFNES